MLQHLSLTVLLLAFGQLTYAQVPFPGRCPAVKELSEFDVDAYTGIWYEYSKYPFIFEIGKKCIYARYGNEGNNTVSVINASINRLTGNPSNTSGYAKVVGPGKLAVVFRRGQDETKPNYIVLGAKYNTYSVVFSCTDFGGLFHTINLWILTRDQKPSAEAVAEAKKVIDANNLSQAFLLETLQDGCPPIDSIISPVPSAAQNAINKA